MTTDTPALSLRDLISQAQSDMSLYRRPDVDEVKARLHPILMAAGLGGIANDRLDQLEFHNGMLRVQTSWSCRGCAQDDTKSLPSHILDADNPTAAAGRWRLQRELGDAERSVESLRKSLAEKVAKVAELRAALAVAIESDC